MKLKRHLISAFLSQDMDPRGPKHYWWACPSLNTLFCHLQDALKTSLEEIIFSNFFCLLLWIHVDTCYVCL